MKSGTARRTLQAAAYKFLHWRQKNGGAVKWGGGGATTRARRRLLEKDRQDGALIEPLDVTVRRLSGG